MVRRQNDPDSPRFTSLIVLSVGLISCALVYTFLSVILKPSESYSDPGFESLSSIDDGGQCCQGIDNLELWGAAVKWGSDFKFNTSNDCCQACKAMCSGNDGPCLCDTWVFCGNKDACGSKFGEVCLKFGLLFCFLMGSHQAGPLSGDLTLIDDAELGIM
ncbi:hypothetical protein ACOSP7_010130 [Xanthoceras sorbifolium]